MEKNKRVVLKKMTIASRELFEKVGFTQEGLLKDREKFGNAYFDSIIYGLINKKDSLEQAYNLKTYKSILL